MSLAGFRTVVLDKLGSLLSRVRAEAVPKDFAVKAQNIRFKLKGLITRPGLSKTLELPLKAPVTGGIVFTRYNTTSKNMNRHPLFSASNEEIYTLYLERPEGSGTTEVVNSNLITDGQPRYFDMTSGYGRAYMAIGSLVHGLEDPHQYDGQNFDNVSLIPQSSQCVLGAAVDAGNVEAGVRYAVVLFRTRNGYISGVSEAAISSVELLDGEHRIIVSSIPVSSDPEVNARIVCFTTAGANKEGPYYYIADDDSIDNFSVQITKTVIENNVQTGGVFNFTDEYLQGSTDITSPIDFFDKIKLRLQTSVFFSPSTRRLIWAGGVDDETIFRVSEPDDPETYLGTTGFIRPSQNDGERAVCAREFRAQLYLFKEHAGFLVYPDAAAPSSWTIEMKWNRVGPVGPWAVDVSELFMVFLDKSGVYLYDGTAPVDISDEISSLDSSWWKRVNWCVKHRFWVLIDTDLSEIHVGVALDQAETPSHVFKCSYVNGLKKRKWSVDYIPASKAIKVERFLPEVGQI